MDARNIFENELSKQSIFKDKNAISPHYAPKELPFREKQIKDISQMLAVTLKGKRANNLFLYGKVGTGKTVTIKHVLNELENFAKERNAKVEFTYVNCRAHNSKYRVMLKALNQFYPKENFLGFSYSFVYEKLLGYVKEGRQLIFVLDEVDLVKDIDDLIYALTRANDELNGNCGITVIGISNNILFKDRLDARTKSSLCEQEMVFPPYNAKELKEILEKRVSIAFNENTVEESAICLAAALAAQESGDARTAVMLLQRAGELAEKENRNRVIDEDVKKARRTVEEELVINMISTLPEQQKLVLLSVAKLSSENKRVRKISGEVEEGTLFSGEVYDEYLKTAKEFKINPVSARWYRDILNELELYGLIITTQSGQGIRGQTRLIKMGHDSKNIQKTIEKDFK